MYCSAATRAFQIVALILAVNNPAHARGLRRHLWTNNPGDGGRTISWQRNQDEEVKWQGRLNYGSKETKDKKEVIDIDEQEKVINTEVGVIKNEQSENVSNETVITDFWVGVEELSSGEILNDSDNNGGVLEGDGDQSANASNTQESDVEISGNDGSNATDSNTHKEDMGSDEIGDVGTSRESESNHSSITFFAIGDVPYSPMEECLLPLELEKLSTSESNGQFLVHLGDIRDGQPDPVTNQYRDCPEELHQNLARIFEHSPLTTFFVPGDNGWLDCSDPEESYSFWKKNLFTNNERSDLGWPELGLSVDRHEERPELFSFFLDGVLFLGQGLPGFSRSEISGKEFEGGGGGTREWYLEVNYEWTEKKFKENANEMKAAVIFGHSSESSNNDYFHRLKYLAQSFAPLPILFLEDGHWFEKEKRFMEEENLYRISLDDTVTPTAITVDLNTPGVFYYDRGCSCAQGHRPTKLKTYEPGHYCENVCDTNDFCKGEDRCSPKGASC